MFSPFNTEEMMPVRVTKEHRTRLIIFLGAFALLLSVLLGRVIYLTFLNKKISEIKKEVRVHRGMIFDRRGLELALSQDSTTIGIDPANVYEPAFTANKLSPYVKIPSSRIESMILEKDRYFLLKRELDDDNAQKIGDMHLPGVRMEKEYKRIYPNGTLASSVIGFTGMDDNKALAGIELMFNDELMRRTEDDSPRGSDIYLSIDTLMQYKLETALGKAFEETRSKKAVGIFMDVTNGKIIAMASFPNFDPNRYYDYPPEATANWAIRHIYEPGSTMKIFIAMVLMNEKKVGPNEKFYCPGYVEFGERIVNCTEQHGLVDLEEILQYSCNVGIIKAISKLPDDVLFKYLDKMKFGQKTGFSNYEQKGFFPGLKQWNPSTSYYLSIGQGIEVTPLQLVTAASALVNGGKVHTPVIVSHITDIYGEITKRYTSNPVQLDITDATTKSILSAMTKVVKLGTGKNAYLKNFSISGKTGTAQKAKPGRGYKDGLFTASFLGFFPAEKPLITGLILFDEPGGSMHSGGGIAAPVFREVIESIAPLLDFNDESNSYRLSTVHRKDLKPDLRTVPDFRGKSIKQSVEILQRYDVRYKLEGSGFCKKQYPEHGKPYKKDSVWSLHFE
ncbi:MAG TPA: penicillin-binding transpeptidase domain-containing protein [Leptospiraceae bacterium]|nr:penicillin-binding transpeptidase domain-containing protein [Leptospiraceae bacterium]